MVAKAAVTEAGATRGWGIDTPATRGVALLLTIPDITTDIRGLHTTKITSDAGLRRRHGWRA